MLISVIIPVNDIAHIWAFVSSANSKELKAKKTMMNNKCFFMETGSFPCKRLYCYLYHNFIYLSLPCLKYYSIVDIIMDLQTTLYTSTMRLDLCSPLEYEEVTLDPFVGLSPMDKNSLELLFCFELEKEQAGRIDPQVDQFLGRIVFAARGSTGKGELQLPAGLYLFSQQRGILCREDCIYIAIGQQKDGLWEQLVLEDRLYIRRLFEDDSPVTQIFRPIRTNY
jgi:hypothetical protein